MNKINLVSLSVMLLFSCEKEAAYTEIDIEKGEQFIIELEANWSTGYAWQWVNGKDNLIVDTIGMEYIQSEPGLGGSSGIEKWTFLGKRPGEQVLEFNYLKSADEAPEPLEIQEYRVNVI